VLILQHNVIEREEEYLARKFGDSYAAYRASVRRWL
jgi:protein-S-isoprenylcysteine O-methyltransferase Ste14